MSDKVNLRRLNSGYRSSNALNDDLQMIEDAFDNTLSRDGTGPNHMEAELDMNSNRIINLPQPVDETEPARLKDLVDVSVELIGPEIIEQAEAAGAAAGAAAASGKLDVDGGNSVDSFAHNAKYKTNFPTIFQRTIGSRLDDTRSIFDFMPPEVATAIAQNTYSTPVNTYIQNALDSGAKEILMPSGTYPIDTDGFTIMMNTPGQKLIGQGRGTKILNLVEAGAPARPILITNAPDVEVGNLVIHANTVDCVNPTMAGGQIAWGVAVLIMGDRNYVHDLVVMDSWDGGIGVGRYSLVDGTQSVGAPADVKVDWCQTYRTGRGIQTQGELPVMAGSGVNNLTGQGVRITNCTDYFSTQGFIADYAAGGFTFFENCRSIGARKSTAPGGIPNAGGQGFYIGAVATMVNCEAIDSEGDGFWFDGYSFYCIARGLRAKGCKQRGLLMEGRDNDIEIAADICSYENPGAWPAIQMRGSSASEGGFTNSTGQILKAQTTGPFHAYGVKVDAVGEGGSLPVQGVISGGTLQGLLGYILNGQYTTVKEVGIIRAGVDQIRDSGLRIHTRGNAAWTDQPFGDGLQNGHLQLADVVVPAKRLSLGFDPVNNVSVIQSMHANTTVLPLELNPSGGEVRTRSTFKAMGGVIAEGVTNAGGVVGETAGSILEVNRASSAKKLAMGVDPTGIGRIQAVEDGVAVKPLTLNDAGGEVRIGGPTSEVWVNFPGVGIRKLALGAADSGGAGLRQVVVAN